jgi:hypothetical protein
MVSWSMTLFGSMLLTVAVSTGSTPSSHPAHIVHAPLCPDLIGQDFLGSCAVTSRNPSIHNRATSVTWSPRFDAEGMPPCLCIVLGGALDGSLATANFRESLFFLRLSEKG